jgi:hypothetical protein
MISLLEEHSRAEHSYDWDATLATMTADCYQHHVNQGLRYDGQDSVRAYYAEIFAAFPDLHLVRDSSRLGVGYGDGLVVRYGRMEAEMVGDWLGLRASGRSVSVPLSLLLEFRDGLLVGETYVYDTGLFCEQLGLEPEQLLAAASQATERFGDPTRLVREARSLRRQS